MSIPTYLSRPAPDARLRKPGITTCMICLKDFRSSDVTKIKKCPVCRATKRKRDVADEAVGYRVMLKM